MRRKRVSRETEGTDPELSAYVDLAVRRAEERYDKRVSTKAWLLPARCSLVMGGEQCKGLPVRIQDGSARRLAGDRFVKHGRQILTLLKRGVEGADGDYGPSSLDLGGRPDVPREANAISILDIIDVHGDTAA